MSGLEEVAIGGLSAVIGAFLVWVKRRFDDRPKGWRKELRELHSWVRELREHCPFCRRVMSAKEKTE